MIAIKVAAVAAAFLYWSVAAVIGYDGLPDAYNRTALMENCAEKSKIDPDDINRMLSNLTLTTQAQKCAVGCFLRESYAILKNGSATETANVSVDATAVTSSANPWDRTVAEIGYAVSKGVAEGIAVVVQQIRNVVFACMKRAESVTDECTLPGIVWNCFEENINSTLPSRRKRNARIRYREILAQILSSSRI